MFSFCALLALIVHELRRHLSENVGLSQITVKFDLWWPLETSFFILAKKMTETLLVDLPPNCRIPFAVVFVGCLVFEIFGWKVAWLAHVVVQIVHRYYKTILTNFCRYIPRSSWEIETFYFHQSSDLWRSKGFPSRFFLPYEFLMSGSPYNYDIAWRKQDKVFCCRRVLLLRFGIFAISFSCTYNWLLHNTSKVARTLSEVHSVNEIFQNIIVGHNP